MNIVELQPALLSSSFPVSDTRPSPPAPYSKHDQMPSQYVNSRHSSKENRTPTPIERPNYSPASAQSAQSPAFNAPARGSEQNSPPSLAAGKKRLANGDVKDSRDTTSQSPKHTHMGHSRNTSTVSTTSNAAMLEVGRSLLIPKCSFTNSNQLSQQLRTRLTYAMIKVQHGWQNRSLDEVESLASASPRSTTFNHYSENRHLLSPRAAMSAHLTQAHSDTSSDSAHSQPIQSQSQTQNRSNTILMSPPPSRKGLAPPANIISRPPQSRRRHTPNMSINTSPAKQPSPSIRPAAAQRTPSQNAVLEADAVETLLFMASPHNSGNHGSQLSPITSVPSVHQFPPSQTSPLRNTFSNSTSTSPKRVAFSSDTSGSTSMEYCARYGRDKKAVIANLVERLDEDDSRELDEALKLMERYRAAKVAAA